MISAYASQVGCERAEEKFWEDFDAVFFINPVNKELIIGIDFNAHVGRVRGNYETRGLGL